MKGEKGMTYIDLNDQLFRQTVVDKEKNMYLGQVSTVMLEDEKTILAVYPKGGHGRGSLVMKKSTDGGLSWGERMPLPESFVTALEVPVLFRMTDAEGKKRLILFSGFYPMRKAVSEDDGASWTELEVMGDYAGICAMSDIIELEKKGEYLALFHDDKDVSHSEKGGVRHEFWRYASGGERKYVRKIIQTSADGSEFCKETLFVDGNADLPEENGEKIYQTYFSNMDSGSQLEIRRTITRDGGLSWSDPEPVISHPTAFLCEPGTIELKDGRIAVLMRDNSRKHNSFIMFSDDRGRSFSGLRELPDVLTGDRHICRRLHDGRIAVTFRDRFADSVSFGDWVLWIGSDEDLIHGRDGQFRFRLKDCLNWDCAYSGLHILPDDTIVAITYGRWEPKEKNYILSVRLHLREFE